MYRALFAACKAPVRRFSTQVAESASEEAKNPNPYNEQARRLNTFLSQNKELIFAATGLVGAATGITGAAFLYRESWVTTLEKHKGDSKAELEKVRGNTKAELEKVRGEVAKQMLDLTHHADYVAVRDFLAEQKQTVAEQKETVAEALATQNKALADQNKALVEALVTQNKALAEQKAT